MSEIVSTIDKELLREILPHNDRNLVLGGGNSSGSGSGSHLDRSGRSSSDLEDDDENDDG